MDGNESDTSDEYLVITSKKDRVKVFCKLYWRVLVIIVTAIGFLPIAFLGQNNAYPCLYIFILCCTYWIFDVVHPGVVGLLPIALTTLFGFSNQYFIAELHIHNGVLNCLGVMMTIVAVEHSRVHRRIALKLLLIFGCSHYRLSFLLFFTCMFLSMWVTNTLACGLMIPIVNAILHELEKMGILEVYHNISKGRKEKYTRHEKSYPRPTDFTIFYFLGIAYSSSIGGLATLIGSQTNEIYRYYSESFFPYAPKMDFPHYMLLNLPGVLLMEALLYLWMNFYFMGMFRAQSEIALEIGLTEEEAQYIQTLLSTQYTQLGRIKYHEAIVAIVVLITILLHVSRLGINNHTTVSCPIVICATIFFIIPIKGDFLKFFKKRSDATHNPYPTAPSKGCLSWSMMKNNIQWSVLFITAGSCTVFEALQSCRTFDEFEKGLLLMKNWPAPVQVLAIILICKLLTEFGNNSCVLYAVLPCVARLSIAAKVNPHYLMTAANLACALPFHLLTGTPANAMVAEYMHIHPWKMMLAGVGPTLIAVCVIWFSVTLWSRTIWPDINLYPAWADGNTIDAYTALTRRFGFRHNFGKIEI